MTSLRSHSKSAEVDQAGTQEVTPGLTVSEKTVCVGPEAAGSGGSGGLGLAAWRSWKRGAGKCVGCLPRVSGAFPGCQGGRDSVADAHCFSGHDSLKTLPCANRRLWKFRAGARNSERKHNFGLRGSLEHQTHWLILVPEPAGAPGRRFLGNLADISSFGRWLGEINPKSCHYPGRKGREEVGESGP